MHRYVAITAEYNHVFIFVVTAITYDTLGIFLCPDRPGICTAAGILKFLKKFFRRNLVFSHLLKYLFVFIIILPLLRLLYMLQEVFFLARMIHCVKQTLIEAALEERNLSIFFEVPAHVLVNLLDKARI